MANRWQLRCIVVLPPGGEHESEAQATERGAYQRPGQPARGKRRFVGINYARIPGQFPIDYSPPFGNGASQIFSC